METSPYVYPGTTVLINKVGLKDPRQLLIWERLMTAKRQAELARHPIVGNFDLQHLQDIHAHLFQDVYEWAGQIRTDILSKGSTLFCSPAFILEQSHTLFSVFRKERYISDLTYDDFCKRAAYYLSELNMLHPFREGNGRAQREFIRCVAMNAGYNLVWNWVEPNQLLDAIIHAVFANESKLEQMIRVCVTNEIPDQELIDFYHTNPHT